MKHVHTTLKDVQEELLGMFSDKTILVGHSLESDLIALKVRRNSDERLSLSLDSNT